MNVYDIITDRIIKQLEAGTVPWRKSWTGGELPSNYISKKKYNGINRLLLWSLGYSEPWYLTFNQVKTLGGSVKSGEHGCPVVFWKLWNPVTRTYDEGDKEAPEGIPVIRYYTVFNITQTTLEAPKCDTVPFQPIEAAVKIVNGYTGKPEIRHIEQRAYYHPVGDYVNMPKPDTFGKPEEYYSTLFHELTHSTGAPSRLKRFNTTDLAGFGSESYSFEELVAELGAAFMSGQCGIERAVQDNQAAYIAGWIKRLKNDTKLIIQASGKAQKAVNLINGTDN